MEITDFLEFKNKINIEIARASIKHAKNTDEQERLRKRYICNLELLDNIIDYTFDCHKLIQKEIAIEAFKKLKNNEKTEAFKVLLELYDS